MVDDEANESEESQETPEAKASKGKPTPKYIWIFVVLVILVAVTVLLSRAGLVNMKPTTTPTAPTAPRTEEVMIVGKDAIAVTDYSAGETVTVAMVVLSKPGYVVVHADTDGAPGAVVGNSVYLPAGESSNVVVSLSRVSVGGEVLYAMLHTDDGDRIYDFPGDDLPTKDEEGNVVLMKFTVEGGEEEGVMEESR